MFYILQTSFSENINTLQSKPLVKILTDKYSIINLLTDNLWHFALAKNKFEY